MNLHDRQEHRPAAVASIALSTIALTLAFVAGVSVIYFAAASGEVSNWWQPLPFALAAAQIGATAILIGVTLATRLVRGHRERHQSARVHGIRSRLSEHAAGADRHLVLRRMSRTDRALVERVLIELLDSLRGTSAARLVETAQTLGLVDRWLREARSRRVSRRRHGVTAISRLPLESVRPALHEALTDPDSQVRVAAACGLARQGPADAGLVFAHVLGESLAVRVIVSEQLKRHAPVLAATAIPEAIGSGDRARIIAALDIAAAWRRSLPVSDLEPLLRCPDGEVARRALRLVPYCADGTQHEPGIIDALGHADASVRMMAATQAGRLRVSLALTPLQVGLSDRDAGVARACALSLAQLGPFGERILEREILRGTTAASLAAEALEIQQTGRFDLHFCA
jgi:HEAT repeat protein